MNVFAETLSQLGCIAEMLQTEFDDALRALPPTSSRIPALVMPEQERIDSLLESQRKLTEEKSRLQHELWLLQRQVAADPALRMPMVYRLMLIAEGTTTPESATGKSFDATGANRDSLADEQFLPHDAPSTVSHLQDQIDRLNQNRDLLYVVF